MTLQSKNVKSALKRKGFEELKDGHHLIYQYWFIDGNMTPIRTKMSHGNKPKDLASNIESQMAKQCGLSNKDFRRFVRCDMDREEYDQKAKEHVQSRYRNLRN